MFDRRRPDPGRGLRRQGLARRCGTCCSSSATGPTGCTSVWGSATTRTAPTRSRGVRRGTRGDARHRRPAASTASTSRPRAARARGRPARSAGCRSGTCSTAWRCEHGFDVVATGHNLDDEAATLLGNTLRWQTWSTSRGSSRSCPGREGWCGRSSRCTGSPSSRPPRTRSSGGSTTWSRSARWSPATPSSGTRSAMNAHRGPLARDQGAVLPRVHRPGAAAVPRRTRTTVELAPVRPMRPADHRAVLRVLPGAGADPRRTARARRRRPTTTRRSRRELVRRGHAGGDLRRGTQRRDERPFEAGERVAAARPRAARYLVRLQPGRDVPLPRRDGPARHAARQPGGHACRTTSGRHGVHGVPARASPTSC